MSTASLTAPAPTLPWRLPSKGQVGMYCLIAAELAIFTIFVVAYLFYIGKSLSGPQPRNVLSPPIFFTICLLSSSITIHFAVKFLQAGKTRSFALWWLLTVVLGALFLGGTAREWHHLIYDEGLTIQTNLFGTTYYSLVGLHAFHVTAGRHLQRIGVGQTGARRAAGRALVVLALCRRRLGSGFHRGLHHWAIGTFCGKPIERGHDGNDNENSKYACADGMADSARLRPDNHGGGDGDRRVRNSAGGCSGNCGHSRLVPRGFAA